MSVDRQQFLNDVRDTSLDGIGYWCDWQGTSDDGSPVIYDPDRNRSYVIALDLIEEGIARIVAVTDWKHFAHYTDPVLSEQQVRFLRKTVADTVRSASAANDASDIDADVADVIVQVGLFKTEVVYG